MKKDTTPQSIDIISELDIEHCEMTKPHNNAVVKEPHKKTNYRVEILPKGQRETYELMDFVFHEEPMEHSHTKKNMLWEIERLWK